MTFWWFWTAQPVVEDASADDFEALATIHAQSFGQAWSADELAALAAQDGAMLLLARRGNLYGTRRPLGFVLVRRAADEAEVLTIVVAPRARRRGVGAQLLRAAMSRLYGERIAALFLEVDASNMPALRLYESLGFRRVGERRSYYSRSPADGTALVMRVDLA